MTRQSRQATKMRETVAGDEKGVGHTSQKQKTIAESATGISRGCVQGTYYSARIC